jgi:hypothetical protein
MRKLAKPALFIGLLSLGFAQTGCFGEFALTRKAYNWHASIGNKFVRSLLLWIPMGFVYSITAFVDVVILNLIEFWSGSNPMSMNEGDYEMQLATINGVDYKIEATKDTFTTTQLTGEQAGEVRIMRFDRCDRTWKYSDCTAKDVAVLTFLDEQGDRIRVYGADGSMDLTYAELQDKDLVMAKLGARFGNEAMALAD